MQPTAACDAFKRHGSDPALYWLSVACAGAKAVGPVAVTSLLLGSGLPGIVDFEAPASVVDPKTGNVVAYSANSPGIYADDQARCALPLLLDLLSCCQSHQKWHGVPCVHSASCKDGYMVIKEGLSTSLKASVLLRLGTIGRRLNLPVHLASNDAR